MLVNNVAAPEAAPNRLSGMSVYFLVYGFVYLWVDSFLLLLALVNIVVAGNWGAKREAACWVYLARSFFYDDGSYFSKVFLIGIVYDCFYDCVCVFDWICPLVANLDSVRLIVGIIST